MFDLIITAVHPHSTDWLAHIDWDQFLVPSGLVAVVTHSDRVDGRFVDPVPAIVETVRNRRRRWREHIAVLTDLALTGIRSPARPLCTARGANLPAYHDLVILGPIPVRHGASHSQSTVESSDD